MSRVHLAPATGVGAAAPFSTSSSFLDVGAGRWIAGWNYAVVQLTKGVRPNQNCGQYGFITAGRAKNHSNACATATAVETGLRAASSNNERPASRMVHRNRELS